MSAKRSLGPWGFKPTTLRMEYKVCIVCRGDMTVLLKWTLPWYYFVSVSAVANEKHLSIEFSRAG